MNTKFNFVDKHYAARSHETMKEVLFDPRAEGPSVHYYMLRGGNEQRNITVWEVGTVGGEYIKTYGHYHVGELDETYQIIFGQGFALLQKLVTDSSGQPVKDRVEEFKVIPVKQGDSVYMPSGYGHLLVNTGITYLVTADDSPVDFDEENPVSMPGHADYELVKQTRGFAYYVVERESRPVLVKNPLYTEIKNEDLGGLAVIEL